MSPARLVGSPGWLETGALLLFVLSAVAALATPLPLLQDFVPSIADRVFPFSTTPAVSFQAGTVLVEAAAQPGCLQLRSRDGFVSGPCCNPHLSCSAARGVRTPSFEVYRLQKQNAFYVATGSRCDSDCCDWRGMSFGQDGRRLDDGFVDRLSLRLGVAGKLGAALGMVGGMFAIWRRRGVAAARMVTMAGFLSAAALLWWNH